MEFYRDGKPFNDKDGNAGSPWCALSGEHRCTAHFTYGFEDTHGIFAPEALQGAKRLEFRVMLRSRGSSAVECVGSSSESIEALTSSFGYHDLAITASTPAASDGGGKPRGIGALVIKSRSESQKPRQASSAESPGPAAALAKAPAKAPAKAAAKAPAKAAVKAAAKAAFVATAQAPSKASAPAPTADGGAQLPAPPTSTPPRPPKQQEAQPQSGGAQRSQLVAAAAADEPSSVPELQEAVAVEEALAERARADCEELEAQYDIARAATEEVKAELTAARAALRGTVRADMRAQRLHFLKQERSRLELELDTTHRRLAMMLDEVEATQKRFAKRLGSIPTRR